MGGGDERGGWSSIGPVEGEAESLGFVHFYPFSPRHQALDEFVSEASRKSQKTYSRFV